MSDKASSRSVTELFAEYVERIDGGDSADTRSLLDAAGDERQELAWRIEAHETMQRFLGGPEAPALPEALGRFRILRELESGGQGRVLLAEDVELGRNVALKVLGGELVLAREDRDVIRNEARSLALLEHPGVVRIFDVAAFEGFDFLVMEHVEGPSLQHVLEDLRQLTSGNCGPEEVSEQARALLPYSARIVFLQRVAEALAYAHDRGVLHRDVTPSNVLLDLRGAPKLIDFGLAHLELAREEGSLGVTQTLVGKAAYLAPEQIETGAIGADPRSDQFTFGVLAYELLCLENPFARETRTETLNAVTRSEPRALRRADPRVPEEAARVVQHCIEREPSERYASMSHVAADLSAVAGNRPISLALPSLGARARRFARRHRRWLLLGAASLAIAAGTWIATAISAFTDSERELRAALERIDARHTSGPVESVEAFTELQGLDDLSRRHARSPLAQLLGSSLPEELEDVVRRASQKLAEACAVAEASAADHDVPFQHRAWGRAVQLESLVCPDCPYNRENRDRGRLVLPKGGHYRLFQQVEKKMHKPSSFTDVRMDGLPNPGYYRAQSLDAERVLWEVDVIIETEWDPARTVGAPQLDRRPPLRRVEGETVTTRPDDGFPPSYDLHTGPFLISELVSERRVAEFCRATGRPVPTDFRGSTDVTAHVPERWAAPFEEWLEGREPTERHFATFLYRVAWEPFYPGAFEGDDQPAAVTWRLANDYAAWVGARLPSLHEIYLAHRDGSGVDTHALLWAEWLSDSMAYDPCRKLEHAQLEGLDMDTGHLSTGEHGRAPGRDTSWMDPKGRRVGFRVALQERPGPSPRLSYERFPPPETPPPASLTGD